MTNWKQLLTEALSNHGETLEDIISITLSDQQLDEEFDDGYGGGGEPFTAWTLKRVYFPVCYDGAEWVGSVSRNPDGIPTKHIGG